MSVLEKFFLIAPVNRITHAVFNGSVAQIGGAVAVMEEIVLTAGGKLAVVSHPRSSHKISFYCGLRHESFYHVDTNGWKLTLDSGRTLRFINSNNLSFPGSFMTYDERTGMLFSGDLFSAYSFGWSLFANDFYLPAMESFHYDHLPFNQLINHTLDGLDGLDVRLIAPSHGSIINRDVAKYTQALRNIRKPFTAKPRTESPLINDPLDCFKAMEERSFI
ncbi:MAG: hypothetical protein HQK85_07055 [Nitrospinae bacterium]|nr:hypothetical protein [Nitrospinota bacterium]